MRIQNLTAHVLGQVIHRLKETGYVDDDGRNYIIRKSIFESAVQEAISRPREAPPESFSEADRTCDSKKLSLIDLLKAFKSAFKAACGYKYRAAPNDWAKLRYLARRYGTNVCADTFELFFKTQLDASNAIDWEPTIERFEKFLKKQEKIGNIKGRESA